MGAMQAMRRAQPTQIAPHFERMIGWLDHHDWWLRKAAMTGLTPLVTEEQFYKPLLTKIGEVIKSTDRMGDFNPLDGITSQLADANPVIRKFAVETLGESYLGFPKELIEPGGQDLTKNIDLLLNGFARDLALVPGGYNVLYELGKKRNPDQALPHEEIFLTADTSRFGGELRNAIKPTITERLIPEYINANRKNLEKEIASRQPGRAIDGLIDLYRRAGIDDYNWTLRGPHRSEIEWDYLTFDPGDNKLWEFGHRFREVAPPTGSENWFAMDFSPEKAGWKKGFAPFANNDGKLAPLTVGTCVGKDHFCGCSEPPTTFWDKEALLMRAMIELPPLQDGYAYRLLVGGRSHYNAGGGSDVWFDGYHLKNRKKGQATIPGGSGRNSHKPWGVIIADDQRNFFEDGKVLLATNGFLRWGHKVQAIKSYKSFWFEAMKLPELPPATTK